MKQMFKLLLALMIAVPVALSATTAFANTAANTAIVNKAVLTYNGGLKAESVVTVSVNLVPALPNVSITRGDAIYTAVDTPGMFNTVTITATTNGPATYTVTPSVTASTNTNAVAAIQPSVSGGANITLGATVTAATCGTACIIVPAPIGGGITADSPVNGIGVNDTIVFTVGPTTYTPKVTSTAYNAANNTFQINWSGTEAIPAADVLGPGVQVGERGSVVLTATPGTISVLGNDLTTTVQAVVTAPSFPNASAATTPANKWTSTAPSITFQKYSRNVTVPVIGTGTAHPNASIEGNTGAGSQPYYTGGVSGKPGDVIEYIVEANNGASGSDLTSCTISDTVPTTYVTDLLTPYTGSKHIFYIDTTGTPTTINAGAVGASPASYVAPSLIVNVGVLANNTTPGTIPKGTGVTIAYQVKIK